MDLILWRHAEARDLPETLAAEADAATLLSADLERPLTGKGEKHAERMAEWLNRFLPDSTRILVSPARRTQQTAQALGRKFRTVQTLAPGGSVDKLLAAARWPDSREPVLVVGHQPELGQTAAYLMAGPAAMDAPGWTIRKGAVWWLRRRERHGAAEVVLVSVRGPETV